MPAIPEAAFAGTVAAVADAVIAGTVPVEAAAPAPVVAGSAVTDTDGVENRVET